MYPCVYTPGGGFVNVASSKFTFVEPVTSTEHHR